MVNEKILLRELVDLQNRYIGDMGGEGVEDLLGQEIDMNNESERNRYFGERDGWIDCLLWVLKMARHPTKKYEGGK